MRNLYLKIALKTLAIKDILFSEKWVLTVYKKCKQSSETKYDSKEFIN